MKDTSREHYSYTVYADPEMARTFDASRFSGPIGEFIASSQAEVLASFAPDVHERRVVDVGTGTGRAALLFAKRGAAVMGVDASEQMLEVARRRAVQEGVNVTFQQGDASHLDLQDRSFDIAVSLRMLMHAESWTQALAELCRVSDGLVIFDYPSAHSLVRLQTVARRIRYAFGGNTQPYRVLSDRQVANALAECNFRVRAIHRQFVLPIQLHKTINSRRFTDAVEGFFDHAGLLRLFGSPVTLVAERCSSS